MLQVNVNKTFQLDFGKHFENHRQLLEINLFVQIGIQAYRVAGNNLVNDNLIIPYN